MKESESKGINFIRNISCLIKDVFLYVAYFPELLRDSSFLDKLAKKYINIEQQFGEILNWLENDRS